MIDSHAHLNDEQFADDIPEVAARARAAGVMTIINVGSNLESSEKAVQLADTFDEMYAVVGLHPHEASDLTLNLLKRLRELAAHPRVVALGETGLDYYYEYSTRSEQQTAFREQLSLADELSLPVVIHSRDATKDTVDIVREAAATPCVLHCFSGSWETASEYLDMGHVLSFAGPITFNNARRLRETAAKVPLDRVLIETDCPYLAPVPHRGKRNEPAFVKHVAAKLAELHDRPVEIIREITMANTRKFFRIQEV